MIKYEGPYLQPGEVLIYGFVDPRNENIRYVGKSAQPRVRCGNHNTLAKSGSTTPLYRWVRKMNALELNIRMIPLEVCTTDIWKAAECRWIAEFKPLKALLNRAEGGNGGNPLSQTTKDKISAAARERFKDPIKLEYHRTTLRKALKGKKVGPRSPETCRKLSIALKGKKKPPLTEEQLARKIEILDAHRHLANAKPRGYTQEQRDKYRTQLLTPERQFLMADGKAKEYVITFPDGTEKQIRNLNAFSREHGLDSGTLSVMSRNKGSKRTQHKGFKIRQYIEVG